MAKEFNSTQGNHVMPTKDPYLADSCRKKQSYNPMSGVPRKTEFQMKYGNDIIVGTKDCKKTHFQCSVRVIKPNNLTLGAFLWHSIGIYDNLINFTSKLS